MSNRIVINGKVVYAGNATSVSVVNGEVMVNGKKQDMPDVKEINIEIHRNITALAADAVGEVVVNGTVQDVKVSAGNVQCGDVHGDVKAMSGNVTCGNVGGNVSTMTGNIHHG
jgi:hypothetical protein